jgi:hypothetical protein
MGTSVPSLGGDAREPASEGVREGAREREVDAPGRSGTGAGTRSSDECLGWVIFGLRGFLAIADGGRSFAGIGVPNTLRWNEEHRVGCFLTKLRRVGVSNAPL